VSHVAREALFQLTALHRSIEIYYDTIQKRKTEETKWETLKRQTTHNTLDQASKQGSSKQCFEKESETDIE